MATTIWKPRTTPLHEAAEAGNVEEVKRLLESSMRAGTLTCDNVTPLHLAAHEGRLEVVMLLVDHEVNLDVRDFSGWTPLFNATSHGHLAVVEYLIRHGANPHGFDSDGRCILHLAAKHLDVLELLLPQTGDLVNQMDRNGRTPLDVATGGNCFGCVALLETHHAGPGCKRKDEDDYLA
jgi:ankyrin repeat protein